MENTLLPDWMVAPAVATPTTQPIPIPIPIPSTAISTDNRTYMEIVFDSIYPTFIERVHNGEPLTQIIRDDPRSVDPAKFRSWLMKDPIRREAYYEARAIGAESVEDEMIAIADATDNAMEDIQRSKLRLDTRRFLLSVWNKKRYSEKADDKTSAGVTVIIQKYNDDDTIVINADQSA